MRLKRSDRIVVVVGLLMLVAYTLLAVFVVLNEYQHIDETFDSNLVNTTKIVASDRVVIDGLIDGDVRLNAYIDTYLSNVPELSLIEVVDADGLRYSHVDQSLLFQTYDNDDYLDALSGDEYLITSESALGRTRKSFVPIYDGSDIIGVAIAEVQIRDINAVKRDTTLVLVSGFIVGLALSILGLIWLSRKFMSELFGFRPDEIAHLYAENRSVIEQLNEALISVDAEGVVTTVNPMLMKMFEMTQSPIGQPADVVFPHVDFKRIIEHDTHIDNKYKKIGQQKFLMNAYPLYLDNEIIGATAVFRSHLEVDALVDQINGYRQIAEALRAQKHEFQNKLHVVLGLIKMKDYEKAENYIMEHVYSTNLASDYYTSRLKDDRILALFVGKDIQSKEFGVTLLLTSDSFIGRSHTPIHSDDIVLVLGNLIDNSLEAYQGKDIEDKRIVVDIFEDDELIKFTVIDQAGGIDPAVVDRMFQKGVSTKDGNSRGTGLSLVQEIVTLYNGDKTVQSSKQETKIEIQLMKVMS